jgi:acyl-[acyl-carrier-protein] desaturase
VRDATSNNATAWARWIRGWSKEENRHDDVLNHYMYLSGRVDMREVEHTVQRLIRDGMTVRAPASPFHGFVYVAFQVRATAVARGNTTLLVGGAGDVALARICGASTCRLPSSTTATTAATTSTLASSPSRSKPARTRFPTTAAS